MEKVTNSLQIAVPKNGIVDEGDGVVSFPNGLTITDGSVQRNGTSYDIDTLDISRYGNQLTGDHEDKLSSLIGEVIGVTKRDGKVIVNKIRYAVKENPYARLAYDLLVGGFSKNFSTETIGTRPGNDGVWWNSELVGLSQVVTQNNYNAHVNAVVHNSLEQAKQDGLNVDGIEERFLNHVEDEHKMEQKDKNVTEEEQTNATTEEQEKKVEEVIKTTDTENEKGEKSVNAVAEEKTVEKPQQEEETEETVEEENGVSVERTTTVTTHEYEYIESEEEKADRLAREAKWEEERQAELEAEKTPDVVVVVTDSQNNSTEETEQKEKNNKEQKMEEDKKVETQNSLTTEQLNDVVTQAIANALKPVSEELAAVKEQAKNAFDKSAKEPEFRKVEDEKKVEKNEFSEMDFDQRYQKQINAAWDYVRTGNIEANRTLQAINSANLEGLKKAGYAKNAITLEDLGNFVIPAEMYKEIIGHRNDYTAILNQTEWKDTLSLEFAWLERVGDINMQPVAIGYGGTQGGDPGLTDDDDRLKPISEYSSTPHKSELEELAAVTVIANSATRFAAVDLLSDAARGYRTDYDRKRAQLIIARLEQAVDETGYSVAYNPSNDVDALTAWLEAITAISDTTLTGTLIFNARTFAELKSRAIKAGANGPLSEILTTGEFPSVWGYRFIVVPNDLMPSLGGNEVISHTVDGVAKRINHAVFFADLSTFTGRTSGGLFYDVSNQASYEVNGSTRSAYQRNELVLRGSFFRGGAVMDREVVAGVRQGSGANLS